jgi:RNA polymerase sigma factor (sigma-70 family)
MVERSEIAMWVGRRILPHEAEVRAWLRRASVPTHEIDDVIQESYAKLSGIDDVSHIQNPRAYFFRVARMVVLQQVRRAQIIRIETVAEVDSLSIADERPTPEEEVAFSQELRRLKCLIDGLPEKARRVFVLRKIEGISQKEIAARLGISQNTVETHVANGMRLILKAWASGTPAPMAAKQGSAKQGNNERKRGIRERD